MQDAKPCCMRWNVLEQRGSGSRICGFRWMLNDVLFFELLSALAVVVRKRLCEPEPPVVVQAGISNDGPSAACSFAEKSTQAPSVELFQHVLRVYLRRIFFTLSTMFTSWQFDASARCISAERRLAARLCVISAVRQEQRKPEELKGMWLLVVWMFLRVKVRFPQSTTPSHFHTHTLSLTHKQTSTPSIIHLCDLFMCSFLSRNGTVFSASSQRGLRNNNSSHETLRNINY